MKGKKKPTGRSPKRRTAQPGRRAVGRQAAAPREDPSLERRLAQALEQQAALAEILRVISRSPADVQPVFDTIVEHAHRLCGADSAAVFTYDGTLVRIGALDKTSFEQARALREAYPMPATPGHATGRAIVTGRPVHIPDVRDDSAYTLDGLRDAVQLRTLLAVPMMRNGAPIGTITVQRWETPRPFSEKQVALLETFAEQAVIAIENVRLFNELGVRNRDLTETLEQQTATGEILRAISASPTDVQPVFDTIARSARRLCGAEFCQVFRVEAGQLHNVANDGHNAEGLAAIRRSFPRPVDDGTSVGRAVLHGAVAQIPDVQTERGYAIPDIATLTGFRSLVAVPIVRDGAPIGAIAVGRAQTGLFPDRQVDLLRTFADQAVIAIENVRLFKELDIRNCDLTDSLERQTATAEILRVISRSPSSVSAREGCAMRR
jgi:GAF domain-containing protein